MRIRICILLTIIVCFKISNASASRSTDTLYASALNPYGRYLYNAQNKLALISSAVHFGFTFEGSQCAIYATTKTDRNYLEYELDGVYQKRIRIDSNATGPVIINTPAGKHTIWIFKATEATTGDILISKVAANQIRSVKVAKAPLIEFIGNSITCGAASDTSDFACGKGEYQDHHNAYLAYGPRVARELGVNYILSSVSGIGIYRTWNLDTPSMPGVYENANLQSNSTIKWDFTKYSPTIVSIALGTNDMSNGDGIHLRKPFDPQVFISTYVNFVKLVKSKYPKAQIALLSSPMIKGAMRDVLQNCLSTIKTQIDLAYPSDKPVATFSFDPMEPHGCNGHPSTQDHLILANELKPFFEQLLK